MLLASKKNLNITEGPLFSSMVSFTIPLILSNLFFALYHAVDMGVLARFAVGTEVAAVGATSALTSLFLNSAVGLGAGANIILARCFGGKEKDRVQTVLSTSILTGVFLGIFLSVVGAILVPSFLAWTNCPAECYADAKLYALIYIIGMPAYLVYNYAASAIRVSGDSKHPLYYMIIGGFTNLVLNILFCIILPYKVLAVAIATLISNSLSASLCLRRLATVDGIAHWDVKKICFDFRTFGKMLQYGFPSALTSMLYPIGNLQIQAGINSFGAPAITGNTASAQYESIVNNACAALTSTAMTFLGQNIGAKKPKRVYRSFFYAQAMESTIAIVLSLTFFIFGRQLLPIFTGADAEAVNQGLIRMQYVLLFYPFAMTIFGTTLQAFGYPGIQTAINLIGIFGFRTVWMQFIYGKILPPTIENLYLCYPVSFTAVQVVTGGLAALVLLRYRKGVYKKNI